MTRFSQEKKLAIWIAGDWNHELSTVITETEPFDILECKFEVLYSMGTKEGKCELQKMANSVTKRMVMGVINKLAALFYGINGHLDFLLVDINGFR